MPCVDVEDLVIRYGDVVAVDGVSFTAEAGEVTVVLGPNGAGKTSTIEHLEGYRRAVSGRSRVLGLDPMTDHSELTRSVGLMLQHGGVPTGVRPREVLAQYAGFFDDPLDPDALLRTVGLSDRTRTTYRRLSGGEQQRLSLALALIGRPRVVFLDEPTAGVDLGGRDLIRSVIDDLRDDGVCVVVTTHDLDEAERLADHVVIIDRGHVVGAGSPTELIDESASAHIDFSAAPGIDTAPLAERLGTTVSEVTPGEYRIHGVPSPTLLAAVMAWMAEQDLQVGELRSRRRLDDVFRHLTSDGSSGEVAGAPDEESQR